MNKNCFVLRLVSIFVVTVCLSSSLYADFVVDLVEDGTTIQINGSGSIDLSSTFGFVATGTQRVQHTFNDTIPDVNPSVGTHLWVFSPYHPTTICCLTSLPAAISAAIPFGR